MSTVTVSPKFQIVLPSPVREALGIQKGMKCQILAYDDQIRVIPLKKMNTLRGSLQDMDTNPEREKTDRIT